MRVQGLEGSIYYAQCGKYRTQVFTLEILQEDLAIIRFVIMNSL